jgi:hypothetical protein
MIYQPDIEPIKGGRYRLRENFVYKCEIAPRIVRIFINKGFEYDGASVPRMAWSLSGLRPDGLIRAAALVHDWLYTNHYSEYQTTRGFNKIGCCRKEADDIFLKIMLEAGMKKYRAKTAYWAVRMFGRAAWKNK